MSVSYSSTEDAGIIKFDPAGNDGGVAAAPAIECGIPLANWLDAMPGNRMQTPIIKMKLCNRCFIKYELEI
jgi:hypothetical protein